MKRSEQLIAEGILFTDQYQLTMAQLYFRYGIHEVSVQFDHFFRHYPDYGSHKAGYCINAGLQWLVEWMQEVRFTDDDIGFLRSQRSASGKPLFDEAFLGWLKKNGDFASLSLRAVPEGRVIHPQEPITVVRGPLAMAQILESPLLNQLNYPILIATKASRIKAASRGRPVLEFGLRRAHDRGANAGIRAALIGGADFTSCVGISHVLGLPPKGTHAHSMVQAFIAMGGSELDAFRAYAETYPDDCILLVDTVNTLESGLPNAIRVFEELRRKGHEPVGVRLDSGDLAHLAVVAAKMLNDAGFPETKIVLSNQLDELVIWQILTQIEREAPAYGLDPSEVIDRLIYGVGTRLITSTGQSALGGVYKLVAVRRDGRWAPALKIAETPEKTLNPGYKDVWRIYDRRGKATADLVTLHGSDPRREQRLILRHPIDASKHRLLDASSLNRMEQLLEDIVVEGRTVYEWPSLEGIRALRERDLASLDEGVKRIVNPHVYHVSLSQELWELKQSLIKKLTVPA